MAYRSFSPNDKVRARKIRFKKESKMKKYPIIFDKELNTNVTGFMNFIDYEPNLNKGDIVWNVEAGYEHRMDLISTKFYGTSKFGWILEQVNNIEDPIKDIKVDKKLLIPNKSSIHSIL